MLFVQDADEALDVLAYFGVDTSRWTTSMEPILGKRPLRIGAVYEEQRAPKRDDDRYHSRGRSNSFHDNNRFKSERSRSPHRRGDGYKRERSPLRPFDHPTYVVDVPQLYEAMKSISAIAEINLANMAEELDVKFHDAQGNPILNGGGGWCAGNECR